MSAGAIYTLNNLVETLRDGEAGYQTALKSLRDPGARALFEELSHQRREFATELENEIHRLGARPVHAGSAVAAVHRGWIHLRGLLGAQSKSILHEVERGEAIALKDFDEALRGDLPADIERIVRRQFNELKAARDRIHELGERPASAAKVASPIDS